MRGGWSSVRFLVVLILIGVLPRGASGADGDWLDGDRVSWNAGDAEVPAAPAAPAPSMAPCDRLVRTAETPEDAQLAERGWRLFSAFQRGWGITVVGGFVDFDGMCRPVMFQQFVFVDGVFAGTLAPEATMPRTDGALTDAGIAEPGRVYATYVRYTPDDPLCCPSSQTVVQFDVVRTPEGPTVTPRPADGPSARYETRSSTTW